MISASEADAASVLAAQAALEAAVAAAEARVALAVEELPGGTHFVEQARRRVRRPFCLLSSRESVFGEGGHC